MCAFCVLAIFFGLLFLTWWRWRAIILFGAVSTNKTSFFLNWFYRRLSISCRPKMCIVFLNTDVALFLLFFASFTRPVTMLRCVCVSVPFFFTLACPPFCRWIHIVYRFDDFVLTTTSMAISEFLPVESLAFYSTNKDQRAYFVLLKTNKWMIWIFLHKLTSKRNHNWWWRRMMVAQGKWWQSLRFLVCAFGQ